MQGDHKKLADLFKMCQKSIIAIGDETRQAMILTLLDGPEEGMRVGDIKKYTHLSQPAVSHHLKILLEAELVTVRKVRTMNFYQLNPNREKIQNILMMCQEILTEMKKCEERQHEQRI